MYQQQINDQFNTATRQFADTAAEINRLTLQNAEKAFGLQMSVINDAANATFAYWNKLAEVRDVNAFRDVVPAGVQVARQNMERALSATQEIYQNTLKTNEQIGQIAKGQFEQATAKAKDQFEQAAAKVNAEVTKVVDKATKA